MSDDRTMTKSPFGETRWEEGQGIENKVEGKLSDTWSM